MISKPSPPPPPEPETEPLPLPLPESSEEVAELHPEVIPHAEFEPEAEAEPQAEPPAELETLTTPEPAMAGGGFKEDPRSALRNMLFGTELSPAKVEPEAEAGITEQPSEETAGVGELEAPAHEPTAETEAETTVEPQLFPPQPEVEEPSLVGLEPALELEPEHVLETEPAPSEPEPVEPAAPREQPTGPSAGTLVIIEDDQKVAEYYATLFSGNGYRVEVATDGVSGVDLCARVQPQVIMLDVMMPRQNGILVLQTLRASDETRDTPVVVLSNFSEPTLIKRALQLGALEYVIKTQVEGAALLQAVPRWMKRQKAFAA